MQDHTLSQIFGGQDMGIPKGTMAGVDISGGGPASRETPVLSPTTNPTPLNALLLSGGSAYGLAASDGAMKYLEEHGIGFDTGFALVPIVCQSDIYDLSYGSNKERTEFLDMSLEMYAAGAKAVQADLNTTGTLAADVMCEAIKRAVLSARISDDEYLANCRKIGE